MSANSQKTRQTITPRIVIFVVVVAAVPLWVLYTYLSDVMSQGIGSKKGDYTQVELKWMSSFDFNQVSGTIDEVPKRWRELDGRKVSFMGEIAPTSFSARANNEFDVVYSVAKCCYSGTPQVQHFIRCTMPAGKTAPYFDGLVEVQGTLHVKVEAEEGKVASVYKVDIDRIAPPSGDLPAWVIWGAGIILCLGVGIHLWRRRAAVASRIPAVPQLNRVTEPSGESNINRIPTQT